jgi:copper transport protein
MKFFTRRFLLFTVFLLVIAAGLRTVFAHALPVQSIPESNAILDTAPAQIEIFFSEAIEESFSSIKVFDTNGAQVDNNDTRLDLADPRHLSATIRSVPDGVYTVVWNVLSTVDGHITSGSFPFAIGNVDPEALAAAGQASQTYTVSPLDILARWLVFLSSSSFTGGMLFFLLIWTPAHPGEAISDRLQPRWKVLRTVGLIVFICGNILAVMAQAGRTTGAELAVPWSAELADLLITTRGGVLILARIFLGVALVRLLLGRPVRYGHWLAFGFSLIILLTISLSSHSAALEANIIPVVLDWIHLIGAGIWIGGLMSFVTVVWSLRGHDAAEGAEFVSRLIPRFSKVAIPVVALLGLTGIYSALVNVGSFDKLFNTLYGETLVVKTILVLPMIALGAVNLLIITGRMRRAVEDKSLLNHPIVRRFRGVVSTEVALGVLVLLTVSMLTSVAPAKLVAERPALDKTSKADDLNIELNVTPGRVGVNTFLATVTKDGDPVDDALEVNLSFIPTTSNIPPAQVSLPNIGNGEYQIDGSFFSLSDTWQVQVGVRRQDAFDAFANLTFEVGVTGNQGSAPPWTNYAGVIVTLMALGYIFVWRTLVPSQRPFAVLSSTTCLALGVAGIVGIARPEVGPAMALINPIPPNIDSVTAGGELYQRNCVPCHGITGRGDGPVGLTLNPPPADLTIHTAPGVHPDGQLFLWISDGFPGASAMPAFRSVIPDEDRWNLVNYLRTLNNTS